MNRTILAAFALSIALAAAPAQAKHQPGSGSAGATGATTLSLALDLDPGPGGWGAGFRIGLPIAPHGLIRGGRIQDELVLEIGGDYLHYEQNSWWGNYSWSGIAAVAGLEWNLWLLPQLALYPKIDLGFETGWYSGWDPYWGGYYDRHRYGGLFAQFAAGVIWRLQPLDLRLELGTELVRLGIGFRL